MKILAITGLMLAAMAGQVRAAMVVGGGGLMTQSYANQVETWLGEGSITLTNLFTKTPGATSGNFHGAADGKGRTITVIEVISGFSSNAHALPPDQVIGGYNPQSWSSTNGYNITLNANDRNAFLFNLTTSEKQSQNNLFVGEYQTFNDSSYGPTFGAGHDLFVDFNLSSGYTNSLTYGIGGDSILSTVVPANSTHTHQIGQIEVYSVTAGTAAVPEPASLAVWSLGGLGMMFARRRRQRTTMVA